MRSQLKSQLNQIKYKANKSCLVMINKCQAIAAQKYHIVIDFNYLNSHLPNVKFSYPEVKHVLNKIGRSASQVYSVLELKQAFFSINIDEESIK